MDDNFYKQTEEIIKLSNSIGDYVPFIGKKTEQMPKLISSGLFPLSVSGLMESRLYYSNQFTDWMKAGFDTGDAIAYNNNGNLKILLDSQIIRELNPNTNIPYFVSAIPLEDELYENIDAPEFSKNELERYIDKSLTAKLAKINPIWQTLSRSQDLLNDYCNFLQSIHNKSRLKLSSQDIDMRIHLDKESLRGKYSVPIVRNFFVDKFVPGGKNYLHGDFVIDSASSLLVGVKNNNPYTQKQQ